MITMLLFLRIYCLAIEVIQAQHHERDNREKRVQRLRDEMGELNEAIRACQEKLPASGAPVTRQVSSREDKWAEWGEGLQ